MATSCFAVTWRIPSPEAFAGGDDPDNTGYMNKIDLNDQIAIITGGAQGFGLATAKRLIQSGARVSIWDRDPAAIEAALKILGTGASAQAVNITDYPGVVTAHAAVERDLGPVSILVNSAGISGNNALLEDYDLGEWQRVIDINLTGTFHMNRVVLPSMKARNYGRIVNIASIAGKEGNPNASAYAASKAGVIALVKAAGKECAKYDIAVNAVTPAAARTRILDTLTEEFIQYMLDKIPRGRFLEVDELASMVAWLVSKENSFTTASVFDLSGGRATY
jgi:NAD(P)-dependent dehydrogenase (short-subunit alcohol dehydrogenase family)